MSISDKLVALASLLENNEVLNDASDEEMEIVAVALVEAAESLKFAAEALDKEDGDEPEINDEKLEELASLAAELDNSDDDSLKKSASVIDELLLILGNSQDAFLKNKSAKNDRLNDLKRVYEDNIKKQEEGYKKSESEKMVEESPAYKEYKINSAPLSMRYCIDHPSISLERVSDQECRCPLDGKVYNYLTGFKTDKGEVIPGADVSNQTKFDQQNEMHTVFTNRTDRLGN